MMEQPTPSLTSRVEISVSCRNLLNRHHTSKANPMIVLLQMAMDTEQYVEVDRSDVIKHNLNPDFAHKFDIDYHFEEKQLLQFDIYDADKPSDDINDHDFLGRYRCSLGELVSRQKIEADLLGVSGKGSIILSCTELAASSGSLTLHFTGYHLDNKDLVGKSDPYLEVYRANDSVAGPETEYTLLHRTEVVQDNLNPIWAPLEISLSKLCFGDKNRTIRLDCYDFDSDGKNDFIGSCSLIVSQLLNSSESSFDLLKIKKKKTKCAGTIRVRTVSAEVQHSFLDFISGGTQLNFSVAVDFTASNGDFDDHYSLHFIDQRASTPALNQYESAITAVGEIIQDYDSDRQFPALGFGAKIPPDMKASHCFPLTFQNDNPFCGGVSGLLDAYRNAVRAVKFFAPTNFEPVIRHVMQFAAQHQDGSHYFILLILTDGAITDLDKTVKAIIEASHLPMSIIIVGIGSEDFSTMEVLDGDGERLSMKGSVAERDIVQFVPFREFCGDSPQSSQAALAQSVLAELPHQVVDWMQRHNMKPRWLSS